MGRETGEPEPRRIAPSVRESFGSLSTEPEQKGKAVRYPLAPLLALMGCTLSAAQVELGIGGPEYRRYRVEGMSREVAERKALRAGFHPYEVLEWDMAAHDLADVERAEEERKARQRRQQRESARRRYHQSPEVRSRKLAASSIYYKEAKDYRLRQIAAWQAANPRDRSEYRRAWWAENKDRVNAQRRLRRLQEQGAVAHIADNDEATRERLLARLEAEQVPDADRHMHPSIHGTTDARVDDAVTTEESEAA